MRSITRYASAGGGADTTRAINERKQLALSCPGLARVSLKRTTRLFI